MGKIAFVFAGQGAQYPGMCQELSPDILNRLEKVRPGTGKQMFEGTAEELMKTDVTQPCVYAADLMAAYALREAGVEASAAAGYSLGEVAALAYAGAFSIEEGMRIVAKRGEAMQRASDLHETGMAAVLKLSDEQVISLAGGYEHVYPVNFNCPGQISLAGDKEELRAFGGDVRKEGGLIKYLEVAGGFHSPYMKEAAEELAPMFRSLKMTAPRIPVYANRTGEVYGGDINETLLAQITNPVLWQKSIENMIAAGIDTFIEVGPGRGLSAMLVRISRDIKVLNVENRKSLEKTLEAIK